MHESVVTIKGQTTIPKTVRDAMGLKLGTESGIYSERRIADQTFATGEQALWHPEVGRSAGKLRRHGTRHRRRGVRELIALDTNVLIRYLTRDDPEQEQAARALIEGLSADEPGYICAKYR